MITKPNDGGVGIDSGGQCQSNDGQWCNTRDIVTKSRILVQGDGARWLWEEQYSAGAYMASDRYKQGCSFMIYHSNTHSPCMLCCKRRNCARRWTSAHSDKKRQALSTVQVMDQMEIGSTNCQSQVWEEPSLSVQTIAKSPKLPAGNGWGQQRDCPNGRRTSTWYILIILLYQGVKGM